jgi:DNA-directed RNA polymerase specialized sigma24 family protein
VTPTTTPPATPVERDAEHALVDRLFHTGVEAHPPVPLGPDEFARGARERARWTSDDAGGSTFDALGAMERRSRGPDVFLVLACDGGTHAAWDRLVSVGLPPAARALTAQGLTVGEADAIVGDLPGHLVQPPRHGRCRTRLGGYRGASSLTTFLAVAALALRSNARRKRLGTSIEQLSPSGSEPGVADDGPSPPRRLEDAEAVAHLEQALPAAWARLTRLESLALLFKCRDDLPQKTIAHILGVGAPRVSRLVESAHARLRSSLARTSRSEGGFAHASRAALRDVIERFLATSFPDVRPGGATGPRAVPEQTHR